MSALLYFPSTDFFLDNANDPDVLAKNVKIEYRPIDGKNCLLIKDDGNGMTESALHRMLRFVSDLVACAVEYCCVSL